MAGKGDGTIQIDIIGDSSELEKSMKNLGDVTKKGLDVVLKSIAAVSAGLAALGAASFKIGSDFESSMSNLAAITGATTDEMQKMEAGIRNVALQSGRSVIELADNAKMVAESGGDMNLMMEQLAQGTALATATQTDLATTLDFVGSAMKTFGVDTEDTQGVVDSLAKVTSLANITLGQISESYVNVGGAASNAGLSIDDVNALLVTFSNAGLRGGAAGTALNGVLRNLSTPTDKAAAALDQLNVKLFEGGQRREMFDIMTDLQKALSAATDEERAFAQAAIFDTVSMTSWNMITADGVDTIRNLSKELSASGEAFGGLGQAAGMAAVATDNIQGKLNKLQAAVSDLGISTFESMNGIFAQGIDFAISKVGELSDAFNVGGFEGLVSSIGGVLSDIVTEIVQGAPQFIAAGGNIIVAFIDGLIQSAPQAGDAAVKIGVNIVETIMKILPKLVELGIKLGAALIGGLLTAIPELIDKFGIFGKIIVVVTAAVVAYNVAMAAMAAFSKIIAAITAFNAAMQAGTGIMGGMTAAMKIFNLTVAANPIGLAVAGVVAAVTGLGFALGALNDALPDTQRMKQVVEGYKELSQEFDNLNSKLESSKQAAADTSQSATDQAEANMRLYDSIVELAAQEDKSEATKTLLLDKIQQLNEAVPGLALAWDEQTNALSKNSEEIMRNIAHQQDLITLEAAHERLKQIVLDRVEAERGLQKALEANQEANDAYSKSMWNPINYMPFLDKNFKDLTATLNDSYGEVVNYQNKLTDLDSETEYWNNSIITSTSNLNKYNDSLNTTSGNTQNFTESQQQAAKSLGDALSPAVDEIISAYNDLSKAEDEKLKATKDFYDEYMKTAANAFSEVPDAMDISLQEMSDNLEENATATKEWSDGLNTLAKSDIDEGFLEQLRQMGPEARGVITDMVSGMDTETGKLTGTAKTVNDKFKAIGTEAKKAVDESGIADKFDKEIQDANNRLITAVDDPEFRKNLNDAAKLLGEQIPAGLSLGIKNGEQWAIDAVKNMTSSIVNIPKEDLEVRSPSKVFELIGQFVSEGLQLGIDENSGKPIQSMRNLTGNLKKEASSLFEDFKGTMSDLKFFDQIDTAGELAKWQDMQKIYAEGTKERAEIDRQVYSLQKQLAKEATDTAKQNADEAKRIAQDAANAAKQAEQDRLKAVQDGYNAEKQLISDRVHFEDISTQQQISMWEDLKVKYKDNADFKREIDGKIFDLRKQLVKETYDAEVKAISDSVYFTNMSVEDQIAAWEKLAKKYANNADYMAAINKNLFDLRKQQTAAAEAADNDAAKSYLDNLEYQLSMTQDTEEQKLKIKLNAIDTERQKYAEGTKARESLDQEYTKLSKDLTKQQYEAHIQAQKDAYNADIKAMDELRNAKDRNFQIELTQLDVIVERYKNNAAVQTELAKYVSDYKQSLIQQEAALTEQQAQRAQQLFEQMLPDAAKVDIPAGLKEIADKTESSLKTSKNLNDVQTEYNVNLQKSLDLHAKISELNGRLPELMQNTQAAYREMTTAQATHADNLSTLTDAYNASANEEKTVRDELTAATKDYTDAQKDLKTNRDSVKKSTEDLLKQYPELFNYYDEEKGKLSLTNEELENYINNKRLADEQALKSKPQTDLLKNTRDALTALNDYNAGMEKIQGMDLSEHYVDFLQKQGVGALDTINAILGFTPEQLKQFSQDINKLWSDTSKMAEEEFAPDLTKVQEAIKGIPEILTTFAESDELTGASAAIPNTIVDTVTSAISERSPEIQAAVIDGVAASLEAAQQSAYDGGVPIGNNIVAGVTAGFMEMLPALLSTISAGMAQAAASAASALQIHSPSMLFRNLIGKNIALGIGAGITDEMPNVISDTKRQMAILTNAVNQNYRLSPSANAMSSIGAIQAANTAQTGSNIQRQSEQPQQSQPQYILETSGSLRDVFTALGIELRRVDNLNGVRT